MHATHSNESNDKITKKIKIITNKLDKALLNYNHSVAHNKQLREEVDKLRRERIVYESISKDLE